MIARSVRYYVEGILAVFYGRRVLRFIEKNGLAVISIIFAVGLVVLLVYLFSKRGRAATTAGKEATEQLKSGTADGEPK